jgi:hypothetical protein
MSDTAVDPADLSMVDEDMRRDNRKKYKKLAIGAPGDIRLTNKIGGLSQGTRAVMFCDGELPSGLDESEEVDFMLEIVEAAKDFDEFEASGNEESDAESAAAFFTAAEQLNLYFAHRANRTLAEVFPSSTAYGGTALLCFIDVFLTGKKLDNFMQASDELTRRIAEIEMEQEAAEEKAADEAEAKEAQDRADIELGRKVREHNLIEKAREAEEKLVRIRKAANKLAQKHGEKGWEDDVA